MHSHSYGTMATFYHSFILSNNFVKFQVREARAFARPNDGFAKQLDGYDDTLFGQLDAPDSNEDAFIAKKKAEREAEKAAILGLYNAQTDNDGDEASSSSSPCFSKRARLE